MKDIVAQLRELIVAGTWKPGEQLVERALVERLGMSRTPVRAALAQLAFEGLLEKLPNGGYTVRRFSRADIEQAFLLRGAVEGLAGRIATEKGISMSMAREFDNVLADMDALLFGDPAPAGWQPRFSDFNERFHALILRGADSHPVQMVTAWLAQLPFASPSAALKNTDQSRRRELLRVSQAQHRAIAQAMMAGQSARAEALIREHAHTNFDHVCALLGDALPELLSA